MTLNVKDVMAGHHTVKIQSGEDTAEQQIEVTSDKVYFNIELKSAAHLQQFVVFNVTPADALVELDGRMLVVNGGQAMELVKFNTMMTAAYEESAPNKVCAYIYDLANEFNRFYHETKILVEEDAVKKAEAEFESPY